MAVSPSSPTSSPTLDGKESGGSRVAVDLYQVDSQCSELIAEKISVSADRPVEAAVEKILAQQSNTDFNLSGYRVSLDKTNGIATIDFRLAPGSKRGMTSLSSCEQLALFGSLRKTLTSNAQWKINRVRFTERGKEIVL
ncbi:MAG: GerMN domain-containing protein [Scytolyngbya sp. HA4215-MV1]|jgi:hypothetical protein|nr:GerMN domain-containing protein [Scytolyngbya sp. HA4215-MV1]